MKRDYLPIKHGFLHRPRLDALFTKGMENSLITVIAGPGYGKTLAVASFAKQTKGKLVWMHLVKRDNNIDQFWNSFLLANKLEMPEHTENLSKLTFPDTIGKFDAFMRVTIQELYDDKPIIFVVDDYEVITNNEIRIFFERLVEVNLENFCFILISNEKQNFANLKNDGGHFRVTEKDLRFTEDECTDLFNFYGKRFSKKEQKKIYNDTGGWPLALYLICSQVENYNSDTLPFDTHLLLAAELFELQYYEVYDNEIQLLLIKLSYFSRFSLQIVKQIGGCDIQKACYALSLNIFINYDHNVQLFAFQRMYRNFLTNKRSFLDKEESNRVHAIAADWFLNNGYPHEALEAYWGYKDYDGYLKALIALGGRKNSADTTNNFLQILYQFPTDYCATHPLVDFCKAYYYLNGLKVHKARELFLDIVNRLEDKQNLDEETKTMLGETYATLADISGILNNDDGLEYMKKACDYLPDGRKLRNIDLLIVENNDTFFLPKEEPGQLEHIVNYYFKFTSYADAISYGSGYGYEWLFSAEAAFNTLDLDKAETNSFQAIYKSQVMNQYDIICNAYFLLMRIDSIRGNYSKVLKHLKAIATIINDNDLTDLYELRDCAESWLALRMKEPDKVAYWITNREKNKYIEYPLNAGRNIIMQAYYMLAKGEFKEAYAFMWQLDNIFQQKGLWTVRLVVNLMKTECLIELDYTDSAMDSFKKAYDMSYHNNIIAPFVDFSSSMLKIINIVKKQTKYTFDNKWIDKLYNESFKYAKTTDEMIREYTKETNSRPTTGLQLTKKEAAIINYLAQGMTRDEVAAQLSISVNGVKKYLTNIYTKLGAINRADAIHIATVRGIIK